MRRFLTSLLLVALAAAALATAALAKEMSVSLATGPPTMDAGEPWNAKLLVHGVPEMLAQATPGMTFRNNDSGQTKSFDAKATGRRAPDGQLIYRVRVVLPEGLWEWGLTDSVTERLYEGGVVRVGEPPLEAAPPASSDPTPVPAAADDSLPAWPFAAAGVALVLLLAAAALAVRNRRLQPTA